MAKYFVYPTEEFSSATIIDGTFSGTTFAPSTDGGGSLGDDVSEYYKVSDGSIASNVTTWASGKAIRIDLGSSVTDVNRIAIYFDAAGGLEDFEVYCGTSATAMGTAQVAKSNGDFDTGWNVYTLSGTMRYVFITCSNDNLDVLREVIVGAVYAFDFNPNIGSRAEDIVVGVDAIESTGGIEFSSKRHDYKNEWEWEWSYLSASMKANLESLRNAVDKIHRKILYYDESSIHYVKLSKDSLVFKEMKAPSIWQTSVKLRQQLS